MGKKDNATYIYPIGCEGVDYEFGKVVDEYIADDKFSVTTYENLLNNNEVLELTYFNTGKKEIREVHRRTKRFRERHPNLPIILIIIALSTQVCSILMRLFLL